MVSHKKLLLFVLTFSLSAKKLADTITVDFFEAMSSAYSFRIHSAKADAQWMLLKKYYEKAVKKEFSYHQKPLIPCILHLIWLGSPPPQKYYIFIQQFKKLHPEWSIKLWTDKEARHYDMIRRKDFDRAQNFGEKSDIFRYEILYKYGGLYMDGDFEILRSMTDLHYVCNFYAGIGYLPKVFLYNGLIGCSPHHPIIKHCINSLQGGGSIDTVMQRTGPHVLTRAFFKAHHSAEGLSVALPTPFFYPFPNCDREEKNHDKILATQKPYSYALHLWASSWVPQL